ncbi:MAG: hypothetical protein HDR71_15585 [Lachnospiraceae bacterium]|nr:hypothetical protein [Lachnospiraceae bacterium]
MEKTQREKVIECLVQFVERTAKSENPPPEALAALPEVARLLLDVTHPAVT